MPDIAPERKAIGLRLRTARKNAGLSVDSLHPRFEMTRSAFYHWETGNAAPSIDQLRTLCRLYGVSSDYILTGVTDWPFPGIEPSKFEGLQRDDILEIQGVVKQAIRDIEEGRAKKALPDTPPEPPLRKIKGKKMPPRRLARSPPTTEKKDDNDGRH